MTNKEAIELLSEVDRKANENGEDGDGFVALKIAIEALKREDHDGCDGCEHEPKDEFTFPCVICKQNFVDMYEPTPEHDREWIIRCIKRDGFVKTDRGDKANQIILEALKADRPRGEWIETAQDYYEMVNKKGGGVNENTEYFTDDIACPNCLAKFSNIDNETERFDFCPNCGADMKGGDK